MTHKTPQPGASPQLAWSAVWARRLERHYLVELAPPTEIAAVAAAICGVHAQILSAAELSLGLRLADATRATVQQALWDERSLVKTYGPRGTVHLLPSKDLGLWLGALSALPVGPSPLPVGVRLSDEQTDAVIAAISDALGEAELTADELTSAIVAKAGTWAGELSMPAFGGKWPRWRQVMALAAYRGALCFGPNRGRLVTYTSPRRWAPKLSLADGEAALAWLVQRYLHSYGPATPQQFARWLAVPVGWASALFEHLGAALQPVEVEGERAWVASDDTLAQDGTPQGVRLLPYFDAYVVGCHPRTRLFPGPAAERALAGGQAGNFPVLLVDGIVAGVWQQRRAGRRLAITVEPLQALSAAQRGELDEQAARIGAFLGLQPELTLGQVVVGPHA